MGALESVVRLGWSHRRNLRKLLFYVQVNGLRAALRRIGSDLRALGKRAGYADWIAAYDTLSAADIAAIRAQVAGLPVKPLISVVMATYETPAEPLRRAIASVQAQIYPHWELCIADDASTAPHVAEILRAAAAADSRIRLTFRPVNGHIAAAGNSALALAAGDHVALLDHDDELAPHALAVVAAELADHPDADILYSDEDKLDDQGRRHDPYFKPDWNPDLFLGQNVFNHLTVYRTALLRELGGYRPGFEGSQDYDLALRVLERTTAERIRHLPFVLYHWRIGGAARTFSTTQGERAAEAARRAVAEHLQRTGSPAKVVALAGGYHRVVHPLPEPAPLVSLLVPTRDRLDLLRPCLDGLLRRTDYPALEVLILDNDSTEPATLAYFRDIQEDARVRVIPCPGPFNFAAINNQGVQAARGDILGFVNNDIDVIAADWLREMVAQACRPEIGGVGAKLLYGDGRIQHGGVVLGIGGVAAHAFRCFPGDHPGCFSWLRLVRNVSANTAACLVMRRAVFEQVGGFDAEHFAVAFNDVDLCLKIGAAGYRQVWTPFAELYHLESVSRGGDLDPQVIDRFRRESLRMRQCWAKVLDADPCYNPNLTLNGYDFAVAFPPRIDRPWRRNA